MQRACIAIVDAAHARIYSYNDVDDELVEERDLVDAGRQAHGMFSDQQSARGRGATDDHRDHHLAELDARFARHIVDELVEFTHERGYGQLVLVAAPKMLGVLRTETGRLAGVKISEIAQDLAWLTSPQVHDHLAALHVIEPRHRSHP